MVVTTQPTAASGVDSDRPDVTERQQPAPAAAEPSPAPRQQLAAISPQEQPQITEAAGGSGAFFVQIAARNDQEAAVAAFATLQQKYAPVIGGHAPSVRKVDLGAKGVWYRLLVGPMASKEDADALCEQLKGAGMKSCFSRKD